MVLPQGWSKTVLSHIAFVQTGLSKSENRQGPSVRKPYLRVANVQDGYLDLREVKEIDVPEGQLDRFLLRLGDLLLTEGGDFDKLGRGCIWRSEIPECVHQNHIFAVRLTEKNRITPQFLAYQMQSNHGRAYFLACAKQTTNLASINSSQLKDFPVLIPPLFEQERICSVFSLWDAAIEKTERLIAAEERRREALGLLLRIPTEPERPKWMLVRADELFQSVNERGSSDEEILSVTQDRGVIPRRLLDKRILMELSDMSTFKLVQVGDFVISLRSFQGGLEYSAYRGLVSPAYSVLRPNTAVCADYFRHYLKSRDFLKRLSVAVVGIRDGKQISFSDFASIKIPVPPKDIQKRRAEIFDLLDKEIALVRKQLNLLQTQKRGLMQKLLTGQWRVKVTDTEAA